MSSLLSMLQETIGTDTVSSMSRQLGTDESATQGALGAALPLMLEALTRNAASPEGAASLHGALRDHDGSLLDDLPGYLGRPNLADGDGILGHVFGNRRSAVEQDRTKQRPGRRRRRQADGDGSAAGDGLSRPSAT